MCLVLSASTACSGRLAGKVEILDHAGSSRTDWFDKAGGAIELMQMGQMPVSGPLVLSLLQACIKRKDLATGRRLHFLIITSDSDGVALFGDQFIRLFSSCGSLMEASLLFCNASKPSSCTWQAIINAHATLGESKKALELYQKMQEEGIKASKYVYSCVLRACGCIGALGQGKHVHDEIIKSGCYSDVIVGNALIDMYAKCGSLDGALRVFGHLWNRDVVSWNAIITGYTQQGHGLLAIEFFEKMQQEGTCPDRITFLCLSKACGCVGAIDQGKWIHCRMSKCGIEIDVIVGSSLVDMYGKCGSLKLAHEVFDDLPDRNVVSWNGLLGGYAQHECSYHALELFEKMKDDGIRPNCVTFLCLLKACGNIGSIKHGEILHAQILKSGFELDESVGNALVDMYSKCGNLELAHRVFDELPSRSVVSWGALIAGYSEHGHGIFALELFRQMQQDGINPDRVTFLCALKACASIESIGQGKLVYKQVIEAGLEYDITVGNTLLDMYAKCGTLEEAHMIFDQLRIQDVVSCNTMIAANLQHGHGFHAIEVLDLMQQKGIMPDNVTFLSILKACGSIGAIGQGKLIHEHIIRRGAESNIVVGTTLVDMYAKFGSLKEARSVFDKLPNPNLVSWSAMIAAYAQHSKNCLAARCMRDMQKQGLKPDGKIYISLFMACSHAGQVEEGYQHFKAMTKDCGIVPTVEHFNCMVELLSRAGRLKEAEKVLQTMPVPPDVTGWMSLLTACKAYGNYQLGMKCFNQAVKLKSAITGGYVLMSSIYADAHMWEGAHHIQDLRSAADARRKPGRAWIEVSNKVHEFTVGDLTHPQTNHILTKLHRLNVPIKLKGYVPQADTSLNDYGEGDI